MKTQVGDWVKAIGGEFGAAYTKKGWRTFECMKCAKEMGLIKGHPLQFHSYAFNLFMDSSKPFDFKCGGAEAHRRQVANGQWR